MYVFHAFVTFVHAHFSSTRRTRMTLLRFRRTKDRSRRRKSLPNSSSRSHRFMETEMTWLPDHSRGHQHQDILAYPQADFHLSSSTVVSSWDQYYSRRNFVYLVSLRWASAMSFRVPHIPVNFHDDIRTCTILL
jgi:hypothetical protein